MDSDGWSVLNHWLAEAKKTGNAPLLIEIIQVDIIMKNMLIDYNYTVAPSKGHFGISHFVPCREVVLFSEVEMYCIHFWGYWKCSL